jgi:hypothetical protein
MLRRSRSSSSKEQALSRPEIKELPSPDVSNFKLPTLRALLGATGPLPSPSGIRGGSIRIFLGF